MINKDDVPEVVKLIIDEAVEKNYKWFDGEPLDFKMLTLEGRNSLVDNCIDLFFLSDYDITKFRDFLDANRVAIVAGIVEQLNILWS